MVERAYPLPPRGCRFQQSLNRFQVVHKLLKLLLAQTPVKAVTGLKRLRYSEACIDPVI
jgi:hypothetical protein